MKFAFIIDGDNVVDIVERGVAPQDIDIYELNGLKHKMGKLNPIERDFFEERAAIMQYDGGLSINEAEKLAFERILIRRKSMN
jgi:hypothetical protein